MSTVPGAEHTGGERAGSWLTRLLVGLNGIGSLWIFVLMILINTDAFSRTLFTAPIDGVNEMIELSIVGIVFLQLGDALRTGRLTRSDGLFRYVQRTRPALGRFLGTLFDGLGALFVGIILYGSFPLLVESWDNDYYVGNEGVFTAPTWPIKAVVVVGCAVTLLQFLAFAWRHLHGRGEE